MTPPASPLAFIDLETTGTIATRDRITEIAIITYNGQQIERWSQLVNPQTSIPAFIQQLTGISQQMVDDQPVFAELAEQIKMRLHGHILVAHNARFDYGFLKNEFKRLDISFSMPVLCTLKLSRQLFPQFAKHNLDSLIERHGLDPGERHRAMSDTEVLLQFWQAITRDLDEPVLSAAVQQQLARPSLPPHLDNEIVGQLPRGYGVYLFFGENRLPLYIGKSNHLRQRVLSHFSADHSSAQEMKMSQQVRHIEWIECAGEIDALITEARLIKEKQPTLNRMLRRNSEYCSWQLQTGPDACLTPQLVYARDLGAGAQQQLYGLFKSAASAKSALQKLAQDFQLCNSALGLEKTEAGKPCFAHQLKQCAGICVGKESSAAYNQRLLAAMTGLQLRAWPFAGPALLQEGEVWHVIRSWCYLGYVRDQAELPQLLAEASPQLDRDTYKILLKYQNRMQPYQAA